MPNDAFLSLQDLFLSDVARLISDLNAPSFRAGQVFTAACQNKTYGEMTNIPKDLKEELSKRYNDVACKIVETHISKDGAEKYLFSLRDGNVIEGVFIPNNYGNTLCVSTQVGCRMGCKFCASTLAGLVRNLTAGEILGQVFCVNSHKGGTLAKRAVSNIVLMGSGEPFDNFDNVVRFLRLVSSTDGINISPRKISLSTCGLADKIEEFTALDIPVNLTISLHAPTDAVRTELMPINKAHNIDKVLTAAKRYFERTGRRIIFEYSLIDGVNCAKKDAEFLAKRLKGLPCHVNLIALNKVEERTLRPADITKVKDFLSVLERDKISATLRRSVGNDIGGACGQLRNKYLKNEQKML